MRTASMALLLAAAACGPSLGPPAREFVSVDAPVFALSHVRVLDGTGQPGRPDHTIVVRNGTIERVGPAADVVPPPDAKIIDLAGRTVLPGLVMLHEHLFYTSDGNGYISAPSFARLYLAGGATTIRTGGSMWWKADRALKAAIDRGDSAGPSIDLTSPYVGGPLVRALSFQSPRDWGREAAATWAEQGATSFKAYEGINREELAGLIEGAHARGLKVTGHLCAVTMSEAAELGIDNLEHGIWTASDFVGDKAPDACPSDRILSSMGSAEWSAIRKVINQLVGRRVAVTSTLPVLESFVPARQPATDEAQALMAPSARDRYLRHRADLAANPHPGWGPLLTREMTFERLFAQAGGLLTAGSDPTGHGGVVAGFSNQREIELLVEAGFTVPQAVRVATFNGARYLGMEHTLGSVAAGKQADLMVVRGDPEARLSSIGNVEVVFKKGIGYDSRRLKESVRGLVGVR